MATLSQFNNTNVPLLAGQTFTGAWERSLRNLEVTCFINSSSYALLTIEQSVDASNVRIPTSFNYTPTTEVSTFSVSIGLPFFRVKLLNVDIGTQAYLSLNTYLIPTPPQQVQVNGSVVASITGIVDVSGNVVSTPALNPAQLRTLPLVVGHWYQVASVGDTPGAVWAEMGAVVAGESVPPVGRQFQCLYAGYGTGTCYDITAPVNTSGTANVIVGNDVSCNIISPLDASGNVLVNDANVKYGWGDATYPVVPQGLVGVKLMGMNAGYETWLQDGGEIPVSLSANVNVAISQDGSNNVVDVSGNTYDVNKNLYVNVQGWDYGGSIPIVIDTDGNTIKIDPAHNAISGTVDISGSVAVTGTFYQATQPVSIAASVPVTGAFYQATQPVSLPSALANNYLNASNTGQTIKNGTGNLLSLFINSDGTNGTNYVKIYNVAVPTASDTPVIVLASIHGTFQNVDCWNVGFSTAIGLRVTAGSSNADNTPPSNTINVNAFYT